MKKLISTRFKYEPSAQSLVAAGSQREVIEAVRHTLISGQYQLHSYECPCGAARNDTIIAEIDRYGLPLTTVVCGACGTLRLEPYLDEADLQNFYVSFYQHMYARAQDMPTYLTHQHAYGRKVLAAARASLPSSGWVFEVGCGAGGALKVFQESGYSVAGCDYSAELIAEARQNGIEHAHRGRLDDLKKMVGVKGDLIFLHHVFEHLNDPLAFLVNCREHLSANGRLVVIVPDVSRIHSFPNPNGDLLVFLHLAHKFNFSFEGLRRLCHRAGYTITRLLPDPAIETATSSMPEFWVEMRPATELENGDSGKMNSSKDAGEEMRRYLVRTEQAFSRRLLRNRMSARLRNWFRINL